MAYRYQPAANLRDKAKGFLNGNYGRAIGSTMMYAGIAYAVSMMLGQFSTIISTIMLKIDRDSIAVAITSEIVSYVIGAASSVLLSVMLIGLALYYLKLGSGSMPRPSDLFAGFREGFSRSFGIALGVTGPELLAMLPCVVVIRLIIDYRKMEYIPFLIISFVAGIIVSLFFFISLEMAYYIANDFPNYTAGQVLKAAWNKISGSRGRLLCMELSFIPYYLLVGLSMGLGVLWVFPLIQETRAQFYLDLMNPKQISGEWEHTV